MVKFQLEEFVDDLKRKARHAERRISKYKDGFEENALSSHYSYHGGWSIGYWEGKLTVLEDLIDDLEDEIKKRRWF